MPRKKFAHGVTSFYTKKGANNFKKKLKRIGVSSSPVKQTGSKKKGTDKYLVQYWKK